MKCKVAVIGAGVIGLTSAVQIQDSLKDQVNVTLFTADKSPNTTGDVSAGFWMPYLLQETPDEKVIQWAKETKDYFLKLWQKGLAAECGLSLIPVVLLSTEYDSLPSWSQILIAPQKYTDDQVKKYSQLHKRNYIGGYHFVTFTCEPTKLLPYMEKKFVRGGGKVEMRKIESFAELEDFDLIVNCTGFYAKYLNHDSNVEAVRGQIARVEAPGQFHIEIDDSDVGNYIIPNQHCVILGGTHQVGDEDLNPRPSDTVMILNGCADMVPPLKNAKILKHQVGLRPGRNSVKLELETKFINEKMTIIIHNYGHGGSGVTLCYGCAREASDLTRQALTRIKKGKL